MKHLEQNFGFVFLGLTLKLNFFFLGYMVRLSRYKGYGDVR